MNNLPLIVFDFETGGLDPQVHEPLQIAALAIEPRKLTPYPNGEFQSYMRPPGEESDWKIDPKALEINKINMDDIRKAPLRTEVWKQFSSFVNKYNKGGKVWTAPIACGQNIVNFDTLFAERLWREIGVTNSEKKNYLFNTTTTIDLKNILFMWFENQAEPANLKLDTMREYFGMTKDGAHNAIVDVKQTADLMIRFLKLHRTLFPKIPFKGAFANDATTV